MEWNVKWDWGDLMMFGSEACGSLKELQLTDWGVDQEGELDRRSFNLSGFGGSVGGYGSDMGRSSSIKSSISASTDSSPNETLKASSFTFEASNGSQGNLGKDVEQCRDEPYGCSPPMEALIGYDGPLTGLKLGKRTVESNSGGINVKLPSSSTIPVSSVSAAKKKKSSSQNALIPCCLVEGCNLDLSSAKEYHRKHRVCHSHSKCPKVIIGGAERRFCQQCSRFHSLSDFDEKKRSCRRRLSDHNARRRKPQQETIQFNSTRLSSWFYDNSKSMNFVFNNGLLLQSKTTADSTWGTSEVPKFTITRGLTSKPYRAGSINVQSLVGGIKLPGATKMQTNASKGTTTEFFSQGVKENMFSLNMGAAPELPCALSLLSNKSSSEPESTSIGHPTHVNQISITEQVIPENLPLGSTDLWQAEQYLLNPRIHALVANGYSGGSFQLSKDPFDNFYFNGLMN
ncbi:squamosa promoter-binding-like protein 2 [Nicotiana sylvestris]|uniref:Squamosa promter-binding-like protein 15 n=4 Tax=Nicotiana TaxID=4085 RepID=A0A240EUR7_TOBAC|nr:PREDICTED: squamosa promoter-binding-like protein 2 [Nicotiana sylvestris]XP_009796501.1 PREDICTED: squamosa promoter-binding-like protein 2 [Nicotiana sylvestris]AOC59156.1 squamosa promter-binding-like protein 15 [Nicotiana tabacum]